MMLWTWNNNIFRDISDLLKDKTMVLIKQEREGEVLDSQLVIGVRQSFGRLEYFDAASLLAIIY